MLGPLPSSPSVCSRDQAGGGDEAEFKENEKAVATESHHLGSQNLPFWQEANLSYHSMLEGLGPRRVSGQVEPHNSELPGHADSLEFEPSREEEVQQLYLVPPWSLREHLHLDSERYLPRDDTPMDPEVCAILKGLEKAPALQNSRPSSRASPTRPGSANRFSSSDFDSLAPTVHAPRVRSFHCWRPSNAAPLGDPEPDIVQSGESGSSPDADPNSTRRLQIWMPHRLGDLHAVSHASITVCREGADCISVHGTAERWALAESAATSHSHRNCHHGQPAARGARARAAGNT